MNEKGITLIELAVAMVIIAILATALGFSYVGWQGAYKVEQATRGIYTDLMDVRSRAMARDREFYAEFNNPAPSAGQGSYRLLEDTNEDGASDTVLLTFPKTFPYVINWDGGGAITFRRRGVMTWPDLTAAPPVNPATIQVVAPGGVDADYDCIIVAQTQINLGKWNTAGATCDEK